MKSMLKSLMSVAVAALAFTSCSNDATEEVIPNGGSKTLVVNATIDQTRTFMNEIDHEILEWAADDEIYLYIGETATTPNTINPKTGGTIKADYTEGGMVYANYSLGNSFSKGVTQAEINIVNDQKQSEANVFAGENLPMTAKGEIKDGQVDLTFKPFGCVLVFNVYGPAGNETIKSIKFETSVGCCGYTLCDLTKEKLNYEAYENNTSATVTLTTPAPIGASKPTETKMGENQVYLVVAPVNYTAATFTVTTTAGSYTFRTANGIDCSQNTARVINLNLKNATTGFSPEIIVPTASIKQSSEEGQLVIKDIIFKNIAADQLSDAQVGVFSDAALSTPLENGWLTIANTTNLSNGEVTCGVAANTNTAERTAYIGITCGDVTSPAITVTQVAAGASADKYYVKITEALDDWTGDYLIVYENSDTEAYVWSLKDAVHGYITVKPSSSGILSNEDTDKCKVAISKSGDGYLLRATDGDNAGKYIYRSTGSNGLNFNTQSEAEKYLNTITFETSYVKITSSGIYIQFYATSGSERFRYYKSNQKKVQLYKLQE